MSGSRRPGRTTAGASGFSWKQPRSVAGLTSKSLRPAAAGAYDLGVVTGMPAWREVQLAVSQELGERVYRAEPLAPVKRSGMTWAARAQGAGAIVVKVRDCDDGRAEEKARWCAAHLPALGARGYPVPAIVWHGMISTGWQVTVQSRLPGRSLRTLGGPMLELALRLVELQADAGITDDGDGFTGYVANVLFDDGMTCGPMRPVRAPRPGGCVSGCGTGSSRPGGCGCRAIGGLAYYSHEQQAYGDSLGNEECAAISGILDRLQAAGLDR